MLTTEQTVLFVEGLLSIPFILLGISHIVQRQMWVDFFLGLAAKGHAGVVWRTFMLEIWPAVLIFMLHQDWTWPGVIITIYGHMLLLKITLSLLYPPLGLKSLRQAEAQGSAAFILAGFILIGLGCLCGYRAFVGS